MSIENGAGSRRSKRTRVPLAVVVNCSAPLPPLTSTVSVPAPPSLRSVSSPGFQIMRSLPPWPKAWSSASPPVSVSFPPPPNSRSKPPLPSSVSLPRLAEQLVVAGAAGEDVVAGAAEEVRRGSAPLTSLSVIVSVAALAEHAGSADVLATVGVPPMTGTAPPLTRILPAALADRDRVVVERVAGHAQHAVVERRGDGRVRRRARRADQPGGEHGAGEQPARSATPAVITA